LLLNQLKLVQFKSYEKAEFHFEQRVTSITGKNGAGKTNLLDALHHLSLARSLFHKQDSLNIFNDSTFYRLDAQLESGDLPIRFELVYGLEEKKKLIWNGGQVEKISEHVGKIPLVYILPDEPFLMNESSEWRRNFIDNTLSQTFPEYLYHLGRYKKLLNQRNATLKYFFERKRVDISLLETLDEELATEGNPVFAYRKKYLPSLNSFFKSHYLFLSDEAELADIQYQSDLFESSFLELLRKNRSLDLESQRTGVGIHKDDFLYLLNGKPIKKFGSQGQLKTFLLSLKMAQYQFLQTEKSQKPWLLLDDIFDKLDDTRIKRLIERIAEPEMGQVFLTDAREERSRQLLHHSGIQFQILGIK
jgi:DNA replication and repair protein RecF